MLLDARARRDDVRGRDGKCRFKFCIYDWPIVLQKQIKKHLSARESAAKIGDYAKLMEFHGGASGLDSHCCVNTSVRACSAEF
jgi:hypothetical protein